MVNQMATVSVTSRDELACMKCGRRASFLSPLGPLCPSDALMAATFNDWIPEQIRRGPEPFPPQTVSR